MQFLSSFISFLRESDKMLVKELPKVVPVPMLIYVAGKLTSGAKTPEDVEANAQKAEACALEVFKMGHIPLTCHSMYRTWRPLEKASEEFRQRIINELNMTFLRRCDAVVLVSGWEDSVGTLEEIKEAEKRGIPVFKTMDDIPKIDSDVENVWLMDLMEKMNTVSRLRVIYGLKKYGNSWTCKDNLSELIEELVDARNYASLEVARIMRVMQKRDGLFPEGLAKEK